MEHLVSKIKQQTEVSVNARIAGLVLPYAGKSAPPGYLLCDGASYAKSDYPELFAAIGIAYGGTEDGDDFCVPNLAGRIPVGTNAEYALGSEGGEATHTLTVDEMPSHQHIVNVMHNSHLGNSAENHIVYGTDYHTGGDGSLATNARGGSQAHNNMQPYVVTNYIISTGKGANAATVSNNDLLQKLDEFQAALEGAKDNIATLQSDWDSISPVKFNVTMTNVSTGHIIGVKAGKLVYLYSSENIQLNSEMDAWSERQVGTLPDDCIPTEEVNFPMCFDGVVGAFRIYPDGKIMVVSRSNSVTNGARNFVISACFLIP